MQGLIRFPTLGCRSYMLYHFKSSRAQRGRYIFGNQATNEKNEVWRDHKQNSVRSGCDEVNDIRLVLKSQAIDARKIYAKHIHHKALVWRIGRETWSHLQVAYKKAGLTEGKNRMAISRTGEGVEREKVIVNRGAQSFCQAALETHRPGWWLWSYTIYGRIAKRACFRIFTTKQKRICKVIFIH